MTFELFRAESEADREELFRFRYAVYVEEMGRYRRAADHAGHRLVDPEDAHSVLYGARQDGVVVGAARTTFGSRKSHTMPAASKARTNSRARS